MTTVLLPLPDGRWLALESSELSRAIARAKDLGFGLNAAPAPNPSPLLEEKLLDSRQMAARLGVADSWIETAAKTGDVPSLRVGRYLRFSPTAVLAALADEQSTDR